MNQPTNRLVNFLTIYLLDVSIVFRYCHSLVGILLWYRGYCCMAPLNLVK